MKTSEFHFELPKELIAQEPLSERSHARMMVVHRTSGQLEHMRVMDLPSFLKKNDLLVVNDTRVIPARVFGKRLDTGGRVELLLVEKREEERRQKSEDRGQKSEVSLLRQDYGGNGGQNAPGDYAGQDAGIRKFEEVWDCFYRASGRPRVGQLLLLGNGRMGGEVLAVYGNGRVSIRLSGERHVEEILETEGFAPVPPYIHRTEEPSPLTELDRRCYQTIYARSPGAVAAPTAGLHFTPELIGLLKERGISKAAITLHVGPGTFKPMKTEDVESHIMEEERYEIGNEAADLINGAKQKGGRIVAVGSTTVRTLETVMHERESIVACSGRTSLFVHHPYLFRAVDVMMTNFHLPESTLLVMVSAFAGKDLIFKAYQEAIKNRYRFYSYGDCMLIL